MSGRNGAAGFAGILCISVIVVLLLTLSVLIPSSDFDGEAGIMPALQAKSCTVGSGPDQLGYDPVDHFVFVPTTSGDVYFIKGACTVDGSFHFGVAGSTPTAAAFDPVDDDMYVTDSGLDAVWVFSSGPPPVLLSEITGTDLDGPVAVAYDPVANAMLVANSLSNSVSLISANQVVSSTRVGDSPYQIAYDPTAGTMLVTNSGSGNVTILGAASLDREGSVTVGNSPVGIAFDTATGTVFVANFGSDNVSELSAVGKVIATLAGFDEPDGVAFSQAKLEMYITNAGDGKVFVLNSTLSILHKDPTASSSGPVSAVYDDYNNDVYIAGYGSGSGVELYYLP